jgi:Brp/Blh family beta-carotene 15,15'-monooxygenase
MLAPITLAFALVAIGFCVLDVVRIDVPYEVQVVPFALSVLLFGLPHGALDHLVPARLVPGISTRRSIVLVVGLYALLGGATALLWSALPAVGFGLFIAVTWFHWGQGDLWIDRALRGTAPSRPDAVLTVLVRGALPMLLPLLAHGSDYWSVFRMTTGLVDPGAGTGADLLEAVPVLPAAAGLLAALIGGHLLLRRRRGDAIRGTVVEVTVLVLFFVAVPPVLAVGLYFTFWHAVRHIVRLELLEPGGSAALERGELLRPFARFMRDALPVTLCAIAVLAGLAVTVHDAGLGTYLLLIAALTTPHTAVVTWMDRRRAGRPTPPDACAGAGVR